MRKTTLGYMARFDPSSWSTIDSSTPIHLAPAGILGTARAATAIGGFWELRVRKVGYVTSFCCQWCLVLNCSDVVVGYVCWTQEYLDSQRSGCFQALVYSGHEAGYALRGGLAPVVVP
jgi:hypothetical protein